MSSQELYHHGIKGQRWGVRRYQNEDGTLTEDGRRREFKEVRKEFEKDRKELGTSLLRTFHPDKMKDSAMQAAADSVAVKLLVEKYGNETVSKIMRRENIIDAITLTGVILGGIGGIVVSELYLKPRLGL